MWHSVLTLPWLLAPGSWVMPVGVGNRSGLADTWRVVGHQVSPVAQSRHKKYDTLQLPKEWRFLNSSEVSQHVSVSFHVYEWHCVVWQASTNVSDQNDTTIFTFLTCQARDVLMEWKIVMEPEGSLPSRSGPLHSDTPHPSTVLFNIILPCRSWYDKRCLVLISPTTFQYTLVICLTHRSW